MRKSAHGPFSSFTGRWLSESQRWKVTRDFHYMHRLGVITVPAGFTTDLDSVPRIPVAYAMFKARTVLAALIHDLLYDQGHISGVEISRRVADGIFRDAMKDEGVSWQHRWTIYSAVRVGGLFIWRRHRSEA